jgi:peptide/nickel transport system ATP-binding protein
LQIKNLTVSFRQETGIIEAVSNISFEIGKAEILAIAGESGSGKSLTALSIPGLLPDKAKTTGSIVLHHPSSEPKEILNTQEFREIRGSAVSMIFQEPMTSLNPLMRCGDQVAEAFRNKKKSTSAKARQEAMEALSLAGFTLPQKFYNRYPHELSGGQKQRVMIAMAIICRPLLLIADEPTTALDVRIQKEVLNTLRELKDKLGMSVLLITHDLGVIADLADRVIVMNKGRIAEQGKTEIILHHPEHFCTKSLLNSRVAGYQKGTRLPEAGNVYQNQPAEITQKPITEVSSADNQSDVLLSIENLSVYHGGQKTAGKENSKAVDDVSFRIFRNEILGLVGESGSGKTTLGRAILGLIHPQQGRILLNGKDITGSKASAELNLRKDLQIVFQDPYGSLNPRMSIGKAIMEVLNVHRIGKNEAGRKEKVIDLLESVRLEADHFNRYPHQFSGGQRQRICIARALATNPSFIVFDEALSALDLSIQAQVLNLINDLKSDFGFTALFISHDLALVNYISDRIIVLRSGKIIEQGTAEQVFNNPRQDYTRLLLDAVPGKNLPTHTAFR